MLRDCKVVFVERFCLRLSVVLRALEDRDAGSFLSLDILAFPRLYSLGNSSNYLPLKAAVEIK